MRILLLEDNSADAELMEYELRAAIADYVLKRVQTEEDFLRELLQFSPDLILSDYDLPFYNGALALAESRKLCPDVPFILVTGAVSEDRAIEILTSGAKDYVLKTRLQQRLVPAIQRALAEAEEHRARKKAEEELRVAYKTMERQVEERSATLRTSEALYHSLFENMLNGFAYCKMIFDQDRPQDFIYLAVNSAFESLTGLKNVVGKKVSEVIPGIRESDVELFKIYGRVAMTGKPERFETYVEALKLWFSISVYSPAREYFVAVFDVITERKEAEAQLRQSEERLKKTQEMAHLGSWELDLVHNRLSWSDEVYRIFGLEPQAFGATYEAFLEAVHPEDREAVDAAYTGSLDEGRDSYEIEHRVVRKSDAVIRVVHEKCEHCRDAADRIVRSVGMVHDITERRQLEHHFKHDGFSEDFLRTENTLIARDKNGGICRDENGDISLECMCGLVISGRTDPENPLLLQTEVSGQMTRCRSWTFRPIRIQGFIRVTAASMKVFNPLR